MSTAAEPRRPVENWEQVRDEWVAAVERFIADAERWAETELSGTLRDLKTIDEDRLGSYVVPRLLIHDFRLGRFVLDPDCRFVEGATGLIVFYALPSYDSLSIVRADDAQWYFHHDVRGRVVRLPWSEDKLYDLMNELSLRAQKK